MDSQDERDELARLMSEQQRLQEDLANLSGRLLELEERLGQNEAPAQVDAEELVGPPIEEGDWVPKPILGKATASETSPQEPPAEAEVRRTPPPVPEAVVQAAQARAEAEAAQAAPVVQIGPSSEGIREIKEPPPSPDPKPMAVQLKEEPAQKSDWELDLGRVWFVRAGVGLLLTGLVFLSLYAYNNWIFAAPAAVKVSFFFLVSALMVVGGYTIERRREQMRQYGQVLSAGGLAAGYYTIYAAHFVPALKIIGSPIGAAVLLSLWAGAMLVYAAWRRGRILAVMSIGLAYYATVVNPSGWISLFSSLLLSASAMVLLMRYRWITVGAVGLAAAYISHAFWLGIMGQDVAENVRIVYLSCNWLLFMVAMQVPQATALTQQWRRAMLGVNNAAFWLLLVFHVPPLFSGGPLVINIPNLVPHEHIGRISIGVGLVWMMIAALTHYRGGWRREYKMIWGFQGLLVATLGMMIEASGYSRFLMLACEACILLAAARYIAPKWTRLAAILCYLLSVLFALLEGVKLIGNGQPWHGYLFASLFGFAFVALLRRDVERKDLAEVQAFYGSQYRLAPLLFAWIPWAVLIFGCILRWEPQWTLLGLCGVPLLVTFCHASGGRRETLDMSLLSPFALAVAGLWLMDPRHGIPSWSYGAGALMVTLYWLFSEAARSQFKALEQLSALARSRGMEWIASVVLGILLFRWLTAIDDSVHAWLIAAPGIAIAGSVSHLLTRRRSLASVLVLFHLGALFTLWFNSDKADAWACAVPFIGMIAQLLMSEYCYKPERQVEARALAGAATTLAFAGLVITQDWSRPELWLALWCSAWLIFSFRRKDSYAALTGSLIPLCIVSGFTLLFRPAESWSPYLFLPILPVAALSVRPLRLAADINWNVFHKLSGVCGILLLGAKFSGHVHSAFNGNGLAICWGLFAMILFAVGLIFMDRLFRRFGLFFLSISLVHILLIDVMKLDTLGRILSFLTLGAVLLLLGYLYNQYQDKIRKYL